MIPYFVSMPYVGDREESREKQYKLLTELGFERITSCGVEARAAKIKIGWIASGLPQLATMLYLTYPDTKIVQVNNIVEADLQSR